MSEPIVNALAFLKPIFFKWEKMRVFYNLILAVALALAVRGNLIEIIKQPMVVFAWILAGIGANICYLAAPLAESYFAWLGIRSRWITGILFVLGVLVSLPLVLLFTGPYLKDFWN